MNTVNYMLIKAFANVQCFLTLDAIGNFSNSLKAIIEGIQPIAWILVAAALLINGGLIVIGGDEGRQKAKKALPWVAVGCIIFLGAIQLAKWVTNQVAF